MSKTQFVLFGGSGYIGQHLAVHLLNHEHDVVIIDKVPPPQCGDRRLTELYHNVERPPLIRSDCLFVHLACPRNSKQCWNWRRAEQALDAGLELAGRTSGTKLLVSSLSVFDHPDNPYSMFKRMAERVCRDWQIARLGTVLGAQIPCGYRADLGLHQIARAIAEGGTPWVSSTVQRHVVPIEQAVRGIYYQLLAPSSWRTRTPAAGIVRFMDIVPSTVELCGDVENEYVACIGSPGESQLPVLRETFNNLVEHIRTGRAHAV